MGVRVKIRRYNDMPVLEVHGKVNSEDAIKLSHKLESLAKKRFPRVAVDLSRIDYIDSHWLGVFVYIWKIYKENGKDLSFVIPPGFILDLFKNSNLDRAFRIVDSISGLQEPAPPPAA